MRISDSLRAAKNLVLSRFTQGTLARNAQGNHVTPDSPEACSFCSLGAVKKVVGWSGQSSITDVLYDTPTVQANDNSIVFVNDELGKPWVEQMFNEAIAIAERREGVTCA